MSIIKNLLLLGFSCFFVITGSALLFYIITPVPNVTSVDDLYSKESIILTDRNGEFLFDFSENEKRTTVAYENISKNIINAIIAAEDHTFFEHRGIRLDAFIRALISNIQTLSFSQGGSTITQQVVKNLFFTNEKKIERKLKEFILAPKVENEFTKEEILELYLNTISYGGVVYGVAEASNVFFGKEPSEIGIAEAAYLASIPKAPTYFSPYGNNKPDLEKRKNTILELMLKNNLITRDEYIKSRAENVHFQNQGIFSVNAPHFVFFVKEELEKKFGPGLRIFNGETIKTTIDLELQREVEDLVREYSKTIEKRFGAKNIAALVLSVKTGEILTMVGSKNFFNEDIDGKVNITNSLRQPGSTFKPFAYSTLFEKGYTPQTIVYDVPTQFGVLCDEDLFETDDEKLCYSPVNYTDRFVGPINLKDALAQSINIPAVKVLYLAGIQNTIEKARSFGVTSLDEDSYHYGLSLVLGGAEVKPLELAQAYNVFANNGVLIPNKWSNDLRFNEKISENNRVISKKTSQHITNILSDNIARAPVFGYTSALNITEPSVAVKTGTTNNSRDIWVVGYSPDIVVLIWAGNSDSELLGNNASGAALAPLFRDVMYISTDKYGSRRAIFEKNTIQEFARSSGIVNGILDENNLHTILHFIDKDSIEYTPVDPEAYDQQYKNWEFGVQNWLEENEVPKNILSINSDITAPKNLTIQYPKNDKPISYTEPVNIVLSSLPYNNIQYEFYVNNKLIGSSQFPLFTITPREVIQRRRDGLHLQVLTTTPDGLYSTEIIYEVE